MQFGVSPEHAVEMYRQIPNVQLAIFPGGDHFMIFQSLDRILVNWLMYRAGPLGLALGFGLVHISGPVAQLGRYRLCISRNQIDQRILTGSGCVRHQRGSSRSCAQYGKQNGRTDGCRNLS